MGVGAPIAGDEARIASTTRHVQHVLRCAPISPAYRDALLAVLSAPGCILSDEPEGRWTQIVCTCCTAAGGRWEEAIPIAAAVECFMLALDVLDDEEDGEETPLGADLGPARLLNVSTGLLLVAQQTLLHQERGAKLAEVLLSLAVRACSGQDADLTPTAAGSLSLEEALSISERKSASLVAAACQLGAIVAGADAASQALYAQFGTYMGMVGQLSNDLAAVAPDAEGKTDIKLRRPTLPLIYAATMMPSCSPKAERANGWDDVWMRGAVQLTWAMAETYRRRAVALIPRLTSVPASWRDLERLPRVL